MPRRDLFSLATYILGFVVPKFFGLLSLRYDRNVDRLVPSRPLLIICNLCGILFIVIYPLAAAEIIENRTLRDNENNSMGQIMDVAQYIIWYVLSVCVFIRQMIMSKVQMKVINRCIKFYRLCERLGEEKMEVAELLYPFILRGIYSYFGYAILNCLVLMYFFGDLSHVNFVYKFAFFMPNIVITTTTIRFHSGIMQLTICGRRINQQFNHCIECINAANNKPAAEFERICISTMNRFEYLTLYHSEWHDIARMMEKGLSLLMLLTVTNAFWILTTTLYFLYVHLTNGKEIEPDYVIITIIRCSLYSTDLAFTFLPANKLKQEFQRVGLIIHNIFMVEIHEELHRTVSMLEDFSLYLTHQQMELSAKLFSWDNTLYYTVIVAITTYLIIFIQFKIDEK